MWGQGTAASCQTPATDGITYCSIDIASQGDEGLSAWILLILACWLSADRQDGFELQQLAAVARQQTGVELTGLLKGWLVPEGSFGRMCPWAESGVSTGFPPDSSICGPLVGRVGRPAFGGSHLLLAAAWLPALTPGLQQAPALCVPSGLEAVRQLVRPAGTCSCFLGLDCSGRLGSESVPTCPLCCGDAAGATYLSCVVS